jgi:hypothetical protein
VTVFTAGLSPLGIAFGNRENLLFAPVFERAILEAWEEKWGGMYTLGDATVEFRVDFAKGGIELVRLDSNRTDWLETLELLFGLWGGCEDIVSYL